MKLKQYFFPISILLCAIPMIVMGLLLDQIISTIILIILIPFVIVLYFVQNNKKNRRKS